MGHSVVPYSITSVGLATDAGFVAVSPQVILGTNSVVGYRYFPPGPRLLFQPKISTPTGRYQIILLSVVYRGTAGVSSLPKATRPTHF